MTGVKGSSWRNHKQMQKTQSILIEDKTSMSKTNSVNMGSGRLQADQRGTLRKFLPLLESEWSEL